MEYIKRENGYVWLVTGRKGFETFYNMGKDPDDDRWASKNKKRKNKSKN